jgi:hypothetical protein
LLEPQTELENIPTSEQKGASAERPTEPSKVSAIGEGLVAKPQRVGSDTGTKRRVSSPEEARGVLEANVKGNREHLSRAATKVHYVVNNSGSGFRTQAETGDVLLDLEKIADHAGKVHDAGGNSEHYISSALQEEFVHSQQIKAAGNQFVALYSSIWKGLTKEAQTALSAAYPDSTDHSVLGAEYERMVIQHLNGDTITEAHHRDITKLLPFVTGKQTTELMNNITRVLNVAEVGKEAPVEAAAPEPQKAPAPKAEARAPPKPTLTHSASGRWSSQDQYQYSQQKRRLTKAINAKDWKAVIKEADYFEKYYEDRGISPPDDWARWARAKDDAEIELRRPKSHPMYAKPETVRDAEAALAEDADFMARQERRKTL